MQDWWGLEARGEIALYEGKAATARQENQESFSDLSRSMLERITPLRADANYLRGRLLLGASPDASQLRAVARLAGKLATEHVGYATVYSRLLAAAVAHHRGRRENVAEHLRAAASAARENDMALHLAAAQYRLASLLGEDESAALLAESAAWISRESIVNPERMCDIVAPGFSD